jgi:hypothetical protein
MIKEIQLKVPTDWTGVSLKKYLDLQADLETYSDDESAMTSTMLYHLCGLEPAYLNSLSIDSYTEIKNTLGNFISKTDLPLQRIITIDGVEYGFEPNLSKMAYGAYVDISKYQDIAIDKNWSHIMSILYRPITKKQGELYSIETYKGNDNSAKFLSIGMDIHFGTLFFLLSLSMDLLSSTLSSLNLTELPHNIRLILERNGGLIQPLLNWQKETFLK